MSFNIGLSGLYAANKALNVTGNNIANVATTGFKSSRAEFADQYSNSIRGTSAGKSVIGTGVKTAASEATKRTYSLLHESPRDCRPPPIKGNQIE